MNHEHIKPQSADGFRAVRVDLDGAFDPPLQAWSDGRTWNGWTCPFFEHAEVARIMMWVNHGRGAADDVAYYEPRRDAVVVRIDGADEPDVYEGVYIDTPEGARRVYPVGAAGWAWSVIQGHGDDTRASGFRAEDSDPLGPCEPGVSGPGAN